MVEFIFKDFIEVLKAEFGWDGRENLKLVNWQGETIGSIRDLFEFMSWECSEGKDNIKDVIYKIVD